MSFRQISKFFSSFSRTPKNSKNNVETVQFSGSEKRELKPTIVWRNVIKFSLLHLAALYGLYLMVTSIYWKTLLFGIILEQFSTFGISAGAHMLWSHRSYEAKWPLRVLLCIMNTIAFQNDIYEWSRDHRVHHKYSETDSDPHNIKRGFFFAHIGWLMSKKHPDVIKRGQNIYLDDLLNDPIVRFQRRFYTPLTLLFCFYLPTMIPVWCWDENAWNSFFVVSLLRYCISLNKVFLVNSVAHTYGNQPFDKCVVARENPIVSFLAAGGGWHNYHHVFPRDYAASELGWKLNVTKFFIDAMATIGLAYNLKTTSPKTIENRKLKYGDGTRPSSRI